ncbi:hypothetical protein LXL04_019767 [Taraxacum kok-saghyz]
MSRFFFYNSYIPENPRTPKPLSFSKNRLRGLKIAQRQARSQNKIRKKRFFFAYKTKKVAHLQKLAIYAHDAAANTNLRQYRLKKYRFFGKKFQRISIIVNVLEVPEFGFLKEITRIKYNTKIVCQCVTLGYPRDASATVLFGEWFRFGKSNGQEFLFGGTVSHQYHMCEDYELTNLSSPVKECWFFDYKFSDVRT